MLGMLMAAAAGEAIMALLVVGLTLFVYGGAGVAIVRRLALAIKRRPARLAGERWRWGERIVIALAGVGLLCVLYAWQIEPYWVEVTGATVHTDKLPGGAAPIRIVHISDLHCDPKERLEDDLPGVIAGLRPDAICFAGDALNSTGGLDNFRKLMTALAEIAPTYAVWGNWDRDRFSEIDLYGGTGVRLLHDRSEELTVGGQTITMAGVRHQNNLGPGLDRALAEANPDLPLVLLCHVPHVILDLPGRGVDVCLAGHVHGGQIALPFYGAIITLSPTGKRFESGLYKHEDTHLYVNRGIGMNGVMPRLRFFSRPEVTVIELGPGRQPSSRRPVGDRRRSSMSPARATRPAADRRGRSRKS